MGLICSKKQAKKVDKQYIEQYSEQDIEEIVHHEPKHQTTFAIWDNVVNEFNETEKRKSITNKND
jgi:hypothetical protein